MITGGWDYVAAAYGFAWLALGGYALGLWWRRRSAEDARDRT